MVKSSSSSKNEPCCSKACKKNTDSLNSKITDLSEKLGDRENMLYHYKLGLSQVEARLVKFKNQEVKYCEKIRGLEFKVEARANRIECLTNKLELLKKEKEGLESKLTGFQSASKDLDSLLESQRSDKNKEGLGYSDVPSPLPPAQVYSPPKNDLSWTGLPEFADDTITDYSRPSPAIKSNSDDLQNKNPSATETEASSTILSKPAIKFVKATDRPTEIKTNKVETVKKPAAKYAKIYRKTSKSSNVRGNQRNWNNLKKSSSRNNYTHKSMPPRPATHRLYRPPMRTNRPNMNDAQPKRTSVYKPAHSYVSRPVQRKSAVRTQSRVLRVSTICCCCSKQVNTARPKAVINRRNWVNDVKASACWVWKPVKPYSASFILKRYDYVDVKSRSRSVMAWVPKKRLLSATITLLFKAEDPTLRNIKNMLCLQTGRKLASRAKVYREPADMSLASSAVTYTSVYTDSEPGRVFWGADEELSDRAPQDEDEHEPMFIQPHDPDFVPEPIYPEYIPLEDEHILPAEEQPLPHDGPVDYPMDEGDDGDDDNGDSSGDDADDEDEDEEEEEEEHLASVDSAIVIPTDELVASPKGTEPVIPPPSTDTATTGARITVRLQAATSFPPEAEVKRLLAMPTPSPSPLTLLLPPSVEERLARCMAPAALPSPPLPPSLHMSPPVDCRMISLRLRFHLARDAEARRRGIGDVGYGIRDTWINQAETVPKIAPMTVGERVVVDSQRVDLLMEDMIAHQETIQIVEDEAYDAREAWAHSIGLSHAVHFELQTHQKQTEIADIRETDRRRQAQMAETLRVIGDMRREMGDMQIELLALREQPRRAGQPGGDARVPNHHDAPRDADSHI
nr:hypothetical protein [Tanacetum cinerariifolium]